MRTSRLQRRLAQRATRSARGLVATFTGVLFAGAVAGAVSAGAYSEPSPTYGDGGSAVLSREPVPNWAYPPTASAGFQVAQGAALSANGRYAVLQAFDPATLPDQSTGLVHCNGVPVQYCQDQRNNNTRYGLGIYVHDRVTGSNVLVSRDGTGQALSPSGENGRRLPDSE